MTIFYFPMKYFSERHAYSPTTCCSFEPVLGCGDYFSAHQHLIICLRLLGFVLLFVSPFSTLKESIFSKDLHKLFFLFCLLSCKGTIFQKPEDFLSSYHVRFSTFINNSAYHYNKTFLFLKKFTLSRQLLCLPPHKVYERLSIHFKRGQNSC